MHEMAICESILGILKDEARTQKFNSVRRISLEVGPLSGVAVEALRFGFDVVTRGSIAEGALLDIVETAVSARCENCDEPVRIGERYDPCPLCGSHALQITGGDELRIKELEVN